MFSALLLVLGILMGSFYLLRRLLKRDAGGSGRKFIRLIDRSYIGVKKSVTLVEVPGKILVLGVTSDRISLLTRIEDPDSVEQIKESSASGTPMSFSNHLSRLLTNMKDSRTGKDAMSVHAESD
jgi:flagellar protein FliO/FliZ